MMTPKAQETRKKPEAGKRLPAVRLLRWGGVWGLACGFSFFVGLLAGRQTAPIPFDIHELENNLKSLKAEVVAQKEKALESYAETVADRTDMVFFESLKGKEGAAAERISSASSSPSGDSSPVRLIKRSRGLKPKPSRMAGIQKPASSQPGPEAPKPRAATAPAVKGAFTIQVASLSTAEVADRMVAGLKNQGFDAYKELTRLPDQGIVIRVRVGAYPDREAASNTVAALEKEGFKPIVVGK
ncbi:MAG: SPOR domain-containing protein [Desulfobacterales bacterium]